MRYLRLFILLFVLLCGSNAVAQTRGDNLFFKKIEQGRYSELPGEYKKFSPADTMGYGLIYRAFWARGKNRNREAIACFEKGLLQHWTIYSGNFMYLTNHLMDLYLKEGMYKEAWNFYMLIKNSYYPQQAAYFKDSVYSAKVQAYCAEMEKFLNEQTMRPVLRVLAPQKPRPVKFNKSSFVCTDIQINQKKSEAIWDTGIPEALHIPRSYAAKHGFEYPNDTTVYLDSVRIGDFFFHNVQTVFFTLGTEESLSQLNLSLRKLKKIRKFSNNMRPLIGLPLLKEMGYFEIDWKKRSISFEKKEKVAAEYEAPMFLSRQRICTPLVLNDSSCLGFIDLGSDDFATIKSELYENAKEKFPFESKPLKKAGYSFTLYGVKKKAGLYLKSPRLAWGDRTIEHPGKIVQSDIRDNERNWDILLGRPFFKSLGRKVAFDFKEMKVSVFK